MRLLRACADTVLVGAGTVRAHPHTRWTLDAGDACLGDAFAELRQNLDLPEQPVLAIVSARGDLPLDHPALERDPIVITTTAGARKLRPLVTQLRAVEVADSPTLEAAQIVRTLHEGGSRVILAEGGPQLMGRLLEAGLVDELFITLSPLIIGRHVGEHRPGIVEGVDLLSGLSPAVLVSLRRHESHLFARYKLPGDASIRTTET